MRKIRLKLFIRTASDEALAKSDSVAQLVEQYTFNVWVLGSNPSGITELETKPGLADLASSFL